MSPIALIYPFQNSHIFSSDSSSLSIQHSNCLADNSTYLAQGHLKLGESIIFFPKIFLLLILLFLCVILLSHQFPKHKSLTFHLTLSFSSMRYHQLPSPDKSNSLLTLTSITSAPSHSRSHGLMYELCSGLTDSPLCVLSLPQLLYNEAIFNFLKHAFNSMILLPLKTFYCSLSQYVNKF